MQECLDLVHGVDVTRLDKVLKLFNLLCEFLHGHLLVLDGAHHLQLLDAVADGDELVGAPEKSVHLNALDGGEHLVMVSLVVPGLKNKKSIICYLWIETKKLRKLTSRIRDKMLSLGPSPIIVYPWQ